MPEFIEPTTRFGILRQFLWVHWHRIFLGLILVAVGWAAAHFSWVDRYPPILRASVSARSIANALLAYSTLSPGSESSPSYPPYGFDWNASLVSSGLLSRSEVFTDRAPPGELAFFYFPPPTQDFDASSTPMVIENPRPNSGDTLVTVVYYDLSPAWLRGDELWNLLDGRQSSDGTGFTRPAKCFVSSP